LITTRLKSENYKEWITGVASLAGEDDYFDYFINGEIEDVDSKLASESLLRFHLLSAIASGFIFDLDSAEQFFSKTFYAEQSRDLSYLLLK